MYADGCWSMKEDSGILQTDVKGMREDISCIQTDDLGYEGRHSGYCRSMKEDEYVSKDMRADIRCRAYGKT